jgi:hypothetical protein
VVRPKFIFAGLLIFDFSVGSPARSAGVIEPQPIAKSAHNRTLDRPGPDLYQNAPPAHSDHATQRSGGFEAWIGAPSAGYRPSVG